MFKCLVCKEFVPEQDWEQHLRRLHPGRKKVLFKRVNDKDVPPMVRRLLDPALPDIPPGELPPFDEVPLDYEEPDIPQPPNLIMYLPTSWLRRNYWVIIRWIVAICTIISIVLVVSSKAKWSLKYIQDIAFLFWQWIKWIVLGFSCVVIDSFNDIVLHRDSHVCESWNVHLQQMNVTDYMHQILDKENLLVESFKTAYTIRFQTDYICQGIGSECLSSEKIHESIEEAMSKLTPAQQKSATDAYIMKLVDCKQRMLETLKKLDSSADKETFVSAATVTIGTCNLKTLI